MSGVETNACGYMKPGICLFAYCIKFKLCLKGKQMCYILDYVVFALSKTSSCVLEFCIADPGLH
jgi:hypothetical protein